MSDPGETATASPPEGGARRTQWLAAAAGLALLAGGAVWIGAQGWRLGALFVVGGLLGLTLVRAGFGFTPAFRRLFTLGDASALNAQLVMLAAASVLFVPVLASGSVFGRGVVGAVAPVGLQVAIGAFLFGMGMQLGGACGSGTLASIGVGRLRMLVTLAAFCAGGFWASLDMGFWARLPSLGAVSLGEELGWGPALALQLAVLGALALVFRRLGARAAGRANPSPSGSAERATVPWRALLQGAWPPVLGALALAGLNLATLVLAGHPWVITWGLTLWAAKVAAALGWDPSASAFWSGGFPRAALEESVFADVTSVMNLGLVLGALSAAALAGRLAPKVRYTWPALAAAVLGGLMMGYGARLAYGCNIGAFFSGVASFSLHGWLWIVAALAGTAVAVRLRALFGLPNETRAPPRAAGPLP